MRNLNYQLKQLCKRNCDGGHTTQKDRERHLTLIANQLRELGYRQLQADSLKPKHVEALVGRWQAEGIDAGTMKNRMSALRWWAEKVNKQNVIAKTNDAYGIAHRVYVTNVSKAHELDAERLARVTDPYTALSLQLQAAFGLRREESMKFNVSFADRGTTLQLKASWCKGGRDRELPIRTGEQRALLEAIRVQCGKGSLIPAEMSYKQQLERFKHQCRQAGIHQVHGHRHQYAQNRYEELTGWKCPAAGGPKSKQLTPAQKMLDREVRLQISSELGHGREQITSTYLGR